MKVYNKYPEGVTRVRRKFQSQCKVDGKTKHIGMYDTPEEAHKAYVEFKKRIKEC